MAKGKTAPHKHTYYPQNSWTLENDWLMVEWNCDVDDCPRPYYFEAYTRNWTELEGQEE